MPTLWLSNAMYRFQVSAKCDLLLNLDTQHVTKWHSTHIAHINVAGCREHHELPSVGWQVGRGFPCLITKSSRPAGHRFHWFPVWVAVRMVVMLMWNGYRSEKGLGVSQARAKYCSKSVAMANYPVDSWMLVGFAAYLSIWFSQYNLHLDVNIAE